MVEATQPFLIAIINTERIMNVKIDKGLLEAGSSLTTRGRALACHARLGPPPPTATAPPLNLSPLPLAFLALLAASLFVHAVAAQQTQIRLSAMTPGTEQVQLVPNGDFQQLGMPVNGFLPDSPGWSRFGEMYVGPGSNMVAADQGVVAQGVVSQANPASGYFRSLTLQPATEYVVSAYLWNLGDSNNHVTTVVDLNDAPDEGQLTLSATDPAADRGCFVYVSFNTSTTGSNITLRCFYDGLTGTGAAPQYYPVGAQWDNLAITRADLFRAPIYYVGPPLFSEGFESVFPDTWSVTNYNGGPTWRDVNSDFGGEGTHTGGWKAHCAGTAYPIGSTEPHPLYANDMRALMSRSFDLSGYSAGQLTFWSKIPDIEFSYDWARVYVDADLVWSSTVTTADWTQVAISLNAYVGGVHTLTFEFQSDVSETREGWYLDDIEIAGLLLNPPSVTTQTMSLTVTQGSSGTFSVTASGDPPLSYQWRFNGGAIVGATSSSYTVLNAQAANAGNYDVVVSNPYGTATSPVATLTVLIPPTITTQPLSQTVVQGNNATFTVVASGTPPLSYQWRFNEVKLWGATSANYTVLNAQPDSVGTYRIVISNGVGSVTSAVAVLTLFGPVITQPPVSANGIFGGQVTLTVVATGPSLTYQWLKNGQPIQGATGPQFTLLNLQPGDAGCYAVVVSNPDGQVVSETAGVTVREANPFTKSQIAHFKFDHMGWPDGFTALNSAADGSNGVVKGTMPDWPPGQAVDALMFNGINNYVVVPDYPKLNQAMTVAGWVSSSNSLSGPIINNWVSGGTPGSSGQFLVDVVQDHGVPTLRAQIEVGPNTIRASSPINGTLNTWHHFAMSANGGTLSIYWDGALVAATDYFGSINATPFPWLALGANLTDTTGNPNPPFLTGVPWSGAMDDIALWSRSLSATEIRAIYNGGLSGTGVSEMVAGFTPELTMTGSAASGQGVFSWPTARGRSYQVEGRSDLGTQSQWVPVSGELQGTGERMDYAFGGIAGGGCRFFRVRSTAPASLRVPGDFPSIPEAIAHLADGGTIVIEPGTYPGAIVISNKKVTLRGSANTNAPTILVATDPDQPVIFFGDGGHGVLSSLTLNGGAAGIAAGSSNSCWRADVAGDNLKISNATRGVYGRFGALRLTRVDISQSQQHGLSILDARDILLRRLGLRNNGKIGMLLFNDQAKPKGDIALVIGFCEIHDNEGGGVQIVGHAAPVFINRCNVHHNGISGVTFVSAKGIVLESLLSNNYANPIGGRFGDGFVLLGGQVELLRCTMNGNARAGASSFGVVHAYGPANMTLRECTVSDNLIALNVEPIPWPATLDVIASVCNSRPGDPLTVDACIPQSSNLEPPEVPPEREF